MASNLLQAAGRSTRLALACVLTGMVYASGVYADCTEPLTTGEQKDKAMKSSLYGAGAVTVWGVAHWDYFSRKPHADSEGWFGQNTYEGGADKTGHVFTTYATAQGLSSLYEHWCFPPRDAALYGSLSAVAIFGYMELGDSFSDYGFNYEDLVANALGGVASYWRSRNPDLARKVDFRWEIGMDPQQTDFMTDYENSKYLLAFKLNGFERFNKGILKHLELHVGYYARGYRDINKPDERTLYVGIGLNLTDLFRRNGHKKIATFLNFYQPPGTYVASENNLSD